MRKHKKNTVKKYGMCIFDYTRTSPQDRFEDCFLWPRSSLRGRPGEDSPDRYWVDSGSVESMCFSRRPPLWWSFLFTPMLWNLILHKYVVKFHYYSSWWHQLINNMILFILMSHAWLFMVCHFMERRDTYIYRVSIDITTAVYRSRGMLLRKNDLP